MALTSNPVQGSIQTLTRYFEERQSDGDESVWLTPDARKKLWGLPETLQNLASGQPTPEVAPAKPKPKPRIMPAAADRVAETAATAKPSHGGDSRILQPPGANKEEKLAWLRQRAKTWEPAKELDSLRDTMVFAVGNPNADIVFVGEAPGAEEERQQEPFVGPAGQLLTKMIGVMGIQRSDVYISNIVKYRPMLPNQTNNNRKPTAAEMSACVPLVLSEIDVIQPKAIVALGGTAAEGLLEIEGAIVGRLRNRFHDLRGIPVMVTYHPSYLLRNTSLSERRKVWEDMLMVMEKIGLPISEKQRGFFLK